MAVLSSRLALGGLAGLLVAGALGPVVPVQAQVRRGMSIAKPEPVTVMTRDNVEIHCTYFAGGTLERAGEATKKKRPAVRTQTKIPGKEVVPVILIPGWEGRRTQLSFLASALQRLGHAVITVDLRGQGESTVRRLPGGATEKIDPNRMRRNEMNLMVQDLDYVKRFLMEKHNAGELNIELLCVCGAEFGGIVATNWAARDWSWQQLPAFKQGQDVQALVLLTPEASHKGMIINRALDHPAVRNRISIMLVAGSRDQSGSRDAKSIHKRLERYRKDPGPQQPALRLLEPETSLRGTRLVNGRTPLRVHQAIASFIDQQLVQKKGRFPWKERKNPLDS